MNDHPNAFFPRDILTKAAAPAWRDCPPGTIAYGCNGGWWTKRDDGWWQANGGDAFPRPGGDALTVKLPNPPVEPLINSDFYNGIEWLACWLLDHAEGETITEEQLRPWAIDAWREHLKRQAGTNPPVEAEGGAS